MVWLISLMETTASCVADCMPAICVPISSVALAVWAASALTSEATTAKPRPASPARAASMVAFSASRLVCGHCRNQFHDFTDATGRLREFGDPFIGLLGLTHSGVRNVLRLLN